MHYAQVGACIADTKTHQIVGIGYNSMPYVEGGNNNDELFPWKGDKETNKINHELKYPYGKQKNNNHCNDNSVVVHAAVNAVLNKTRESIEGCTIYLTHFPDKDCAHAIIKAGITEVVYCMFTRRDEREAQDDVKFAKKIFEKNSVQNKDM